MAWSNKSDRDRLSVEKSHSLSLSIRVEDRLHRDIIQPNDKLWFTVRPENYKVGANDLDAEISVEAVRVTTEHGQLFRLHIQASELDLDPELEWFYDITYVREGYSLSLVSGEFEVAANPTNRGSGETFSGGGGVFGLVATVNDRTLMTVTRNLPTPDKGDAGKGSFLTSDALSEVVGTEVTVPAGTITTFGRDVQVGDILFSTSTKGVMAVVEALQITTGLVSVTARVVQVYGMETLKAILDTVPRAETVTTIDHQWTVPKADAPLPPSYQHRVGDMVFSQAANPGALDKYMTISLVTAVNANDLSVTTKIVFPMFADLDTLQDMLDTKVAKTQTINGVALTGPNTEVNADAVPDGTSKKLMTAAERTKLDGIATDATKNQTDTYLRSRANHTGTQAISTVTALQSELDARPVSDAIDNIWHGTQAMYDQIVTKDPRTLYFIKTA